MYINEIKEILQKVPELLSSLKAEAWIAISAIAAGAIKAGASLPHMARALKEHYQIQKLKTVDQNPHLELQKGDRVVHADSGQATVLGCSKGDEGELLYLVCFDSDPEEPVYISATDPELFSIASTDAQLLKVNTPAPQTIASQPIESQQEIEKPYYNPFLQMGTRVWHPTYGNGTILIDSADTNHEHFETRGALYQIQFDNGQVHPFPIKDPAFDCRSVHRD